MPNGIDSLRQAKSLRGEAQQIGSFIPKAGFAAPGLAFAAGQNIGTARRLEDEAKQDIIDYQNRLEEERQKQVTQQQSMSDLKIIGNTFDIAEQVYKRTNNPQMAADFFNQELKKAGVNAAPFRNLRFSPDGNHAAIEYYASLDKKTGDIQVKRISIDGQGNFKVFKGTDENGQPVFEPASTEDLQGFMPVKTLKTLSEVTSKAKKVRETTGKERAKNLQGRINRLNTQSIALKRTRSTLIDPLTKFPKAGKQKQLNDIENQLTQINNEIAELNKQLGIATGTTVREGISNIEPPPEQTPQRKSLADILADRAANI
jgi:hypothetical protein